MLHLFRSLFRPDARLVAEKARLTSEVARALELLTCERAHVQELTRLNAALTRQLNRQRDERGRFVR